MKRWFKIIILLGLLVAIAACKPSGNSLTSVSMLPTPTPVSLLQSPLATPTAAPLAVPITAPTATPIPTATPMTVPPPPPNWPTGEPWPPRPSTPQPTIAPKPFAAPAFRSVPQGTQPANLQNIWYPYFPDLGSLPQLRAVQMDGQGRRWGQSDRVLNIKIPKPGIGPDPGPILVDLHVSPDNRWMVADFAYVGSQLVDLSSGQPRSLVSDSSISSWSFLAWTPDSQRILISLSDGVKLLDLASTISETVDFPKDEYGPYLQAGAYSPDSKYLADAVVYPAVHGVRDVEVTEIGVRTGDHGDRKPLLQIPGGVLVVPNSLIWSPDGSKLSWVVGVVPTSTFSVANMESQLWVLDIATGQAGTVATLAQGIEYEHIPVWSPDSRYIAYIKESTPGGNDAYLFEVQSASQRQLTKLNGKRISHLSWSPNGQQLAFNLSLGNRGEIWATDLQGANAYPVAGPALIDAPFIWLP